MGPEVAHETTVQVRYGETDQMGVVYHANYLVYMEEGRTRCMEALGLPYHALESRGFGLVVRKANLRFRAPARYAEILTVRTRIARVGGASILFEYEIVRRSDGQGIADGATELACLDLGKPGRPVCLLPDELRQLAATDHAGRSKSSAADSTSNSDSTSTSSSTSAAGS